MILAAGKFCFYWIQKWANFNNKLNYSYDSLTIYDGNSNTASMIGEYCGSTVPTSEVSTTNLVLIQLSSDGGVTGTGFKLKYHPYSNLTWIK